LPLLVGALAFAPSASPSHRDACGVTVQPARGAAPLEVTFAALCASSTYTWSFGDGQEAQGQTVRHVFAAGLWRPTLASDAGTDALPPVTAIAVVLTGPRQTPYAHWITLHVAVTPALPAAIRSRTVRGGTLRLRALTTAPYVAVAGGVASAPLDVALAPRITIGIRGTPAVGKPARVFAVLHPANAGKVRLTVDGRSSGSVDTRRAHTAQVVAVSLPAPGWLAARATLSVRIAQPDLAAGSTGPGVLELEAALAALHYIVPPRSTVFSIELTDSVYAFQKVNRIARTGIADAATWRALARPAEPRPRYRTPGLHVEIDKALQVLFVVRGGSITQISPVSTAGIPGYFTPVGRFAVYRKVDGFDPSPLGTLYEPSYFTGGYAIHGNPSVPPYPASHGCVRVPMWIAPTLYGELALGTAVDVY
jgi:N-acetylmuramoyl-L-alanine amidase